jgi:hypothetical protein
MNRLGSDDRSALDRDADQRWIGRPISIRSGDRSGLDRDADQRWIGRPIRLGITGDSGLRIEHKFFYYFYQILSK